MIKGFIKNQNLTIDTPLVVSDTINYLTAEFSFLTKDWHDTTKWAHFAQGDTVYDVLLENDAITSDKGLNLSEGVWNIYLHGNSSDGMRVTTEVKTFKVAKTGVLNGEPLPTLPLTAAEQILSKIGALDNLLTVDKENLVAAINEVFNRGGDITPEQIADAIEDYFENNPDAITGGYYTPEVQQTSSDTVKFSFTGSSAELPQVANVEITLPQGEKGDTGEQGPKGDDYVLTEADKQEIADMVEVTGSGVIAQPNQPAETGVFWLDTDDEGDGELPTTLPNPNALTFTGAVTATYDGSEPVTVNIPQGGGGGGNGFDLPLLYEITTTEEVRWIDTGDNAFEAKNIIVIELLAKATATNEADKPIACSAYTENTKPTSPWANYALLFNNSSTNALMKQYDRVARIIGIAGNGGSWTALVSFRNMVNNAPQTAIMQMSENDVLKMPIKGIIIGDAAAASGTRVFGVGTTLKVWGC